ncbi:MAG: cobalamin-dependent protein, partial [Deltaproteobacteria bacterium]|nr:cobalamin-dependent protein [Deltaproteobacteria bacterium]
MARVAFYQNVQWELHGVMSLAAVLKRRGHECRVFIGDRELDRSIGEYRPDLAAFTCSSAHADWTRAAARRVKASINVPVVVGGIHPTFSATSLLD